MGTYLSYCGELNGGGGGNPKGKRELFRDPVGSKVQIYCAPLEMMANWLRGCWNRH